MAILYFEGFEVAILPAQLTTSGTATAGSPRSNAGSRCHDFTVGVNDTGTIGNSTLLSSDPSEMFFSVQLFSAAMTSNCYSLLFYNQAGTSMGSFLFRGGNTITGTLCGQTITGTLTSYANSTWFNLEIRIKIHATTGVITIKKDGLTDVDLQNVNTTQSAVNTGVGGFNFTRSSVFATTTLSIDDIMIVDTSGSVNNTWIGDIRILGLMPNGNGNYSEMLGSDGNQTDNYLLVDENPYSGSDYVEADTAGERDTYLLTDLTLPSGWTPLAVRQSAVAHETVATGTSLLEMGFRIDSTDYWDSAKQMLMTTTATHYNGSIYELNPDTGLAWTDADIDGMEIGVRKIP